MKPVDPAPSKSNAERLERRRFSLRQRLVLALVSFAGYWVIRVLGATLRVAWSEEDDIPAGRIPRPAIYSFWHQCIFPAAALFRGQRIAVMTSLSFDGEFIARIIEKLGFRAVRGSSSRGAVGALLGMRRQVEAGEAVAFTIDGPRGPKYVAKPGPVLLAQSTGAPMAAFHIAVVGRDAHPQAVFESASPSQPPHIRAGERECRGGQGSSRGSAERAGAGARFRRGPCGRSGERGVPPLRSADAAAWIGRPEGAGCNSQPAGFTVKRSFRSFSALNSVRASLAEPDAIGRGAYFG
jgi:lysophospholipid acyltransferase (LPLAT)-like uncharacterized protein